MASERLIKSLDSVERIISLSATVLPAWSVTERAYVCSEPDGILPSIIIMSICTSYIELDSGDQTNVLIAIHY